MVLHLFCCLKGCRSLLHLLGRAEHRQQQGARPRMPMRLRALLRGSAKDTRAVSHAKRSLRNSPTQWCAGSSCQSESQAHILGTPNPPPLRKRTFTKIVSSSAWSGLSSRGAFLILFGFSKSWQRCMDCHLSVTSARRSASPCSSCTSSKSLKTLPSASETGASACHGSSKPRLLPLGPSSWAV